MFFGANDVLFKGKYRIPSARLKGWDYSACGYYFVTICTKNKEPCFGDIVEIDDEPGVEIRLSAMGKVIEEGWKKIPEQYAHVSLDVHQIMPDHFHGILSIDEQKEGITLGVIINQFKARCTTKIRASGFSDFAWQSRFHDHIIRDEKDLERIRMYIRNNPTRWLFGA